MYDEVIYLLFTETNKFVHHQNHWVIKWVAIAAVEIKKYLGLTL